MMFWDTRIIEIDGRFWWNTWCEARSLELAGWADTREGAEHAVAAEIDDASNPVPLDRSNAETPVTPDSGQAARSHPAGATPPDCGPSR
jgi:hypothetical protein